MKYLFRGGTVVSGRGTRRADVLVEDEKILRVARSISAPEATVIDVEGQLAAAGLHRRPYPFRPGRVQHHNGGRFLLRQPVGAAGRHHHGGGFCLPE